MSIGHKIYFEKGLRDDSQGRNVDYFIEREYKTSFVEGVSLRMCVATEIVKFDNKNRHKEIIRFDKDGKVKERITYSWEGLVNIVDTYKYNEHVCRHIIEYDLNFRHIKNEWYDIEGGNLVYRGAETTKYDENGNEVYSAWINASRNDSCWKWVTEYSNNGKIVKKSYYRGSHLNDFSHSVYSTYDEDRNVIEKRIVHREGATHSQDSIELNKYVDGRIISHIAKYVFSDGREQKYEEDTYIYIENKLSKIQHLNNRETQYFYNQLGLLNMELDLKDGNVASIKNYFYDDMNNEILRIWNRISENERITYEYKYDENGNKIYEKRIEESPKERKIVETEWELFYQKSSVLLSKDYL